MLIPASMRLAFDVPEASVMHLAVYNLLGRLVVEGEVAAGHHEVTYVLRLATPRGIFIKKKVYLK